MNDFSIYWSESLTWAKCSMTQGFKANPQGPVLRSTLWSPLSNCCASPCSQAGTCSMGRIAPFCVFTLGYDVDETTLSWKSFVGGTQSLFSGDFCSHECISQQTCRAQEWNAIPAKWLLLDEVVNMGFSLKMDFLELVNWTQNQSRCIWALPCALPVGTLGPHHIICWLLLGRAPW